MAKSIITQDGDLVNYNNLVAISVEERAVGFDEEHSEDEYCIIGTDVKNGEILLVEIRIAVVGFLLLNNKKTIVVIQLFLSDVVIEVLPKNGIGGQLP